MWLKLRRYSHKKPKKLIYLSLITTKHSISCLERIAYLMLIGKQDVIFRFTVKKYEIASERRLLAMTYYEKWFCHCEPFAFVIASRRRSNLVFLLRVNSAKQSQGFACSPWIAVIFLTLVLQSHICNYSLKSENGEFILKNVSQYGTPPVPCPVP